MTTLRFNQSVNTSKGRGTFVGYFSDGLRCLVARKVPVTEFSKDDQVARKRDLVNFSSAEYNDWLKDATFNRIEIFNNDDVTALHLVPA